MKTICLGEKYNTPIAIALGFFDCIHRGHRLLVRTAQDYADSHQGIESALLTFCNDPSNLLGGEKQIYSFAEREESLNNLGLQTLIYTKFSREFAQIEPSDFLDNLTETLNIKAIVVGEDYTFGKQAQGNVMFLCDYCGKKGIDVIVKPFEEDGGHKISTSSMKNLVKTGNIAALNALLSEPYFIVGKVEHARHVGTKLGFPTANICPSDEKLPLESGVYATVLYVDNKAFASMTNVGAKPTFDIASSSIEAYVLDFDGDLYGKTVKLSFIYRMRDIKKFRTADELKSQLEYDERQVRLNIDLKEL